MQDCGNCTLCCKLPRIPEANSIAGEWCTHCTPGVGCKIYKDRPESCRIYECIWKQMERVKPSLRPDRCHMIFEKWTDNLIIGSTDVPGISFLLMGQIDSFRKEGISVVVLNHVEKSKTFYLAPGHTKEFIKREIDGRTNVLNRSSNPRHRR